MHCFVRSRFSLDWMVEDVESEVTEVTDWAAAVEEEKWQEKHDEVKLRKDDVRLESVMVASCSDDGTLRIWLPTLV